MLCHLVAIKTQTHPFINEQTHDDLPFTLCFFAICRVNQITREVCKHMYLFMHKNKTSYNLRENTLDIQCTKYLQNMIQKKKIRSQIQTWNSIVSMTIISNSGNHSWKHCIHKAKWYSSIKQNICNDKNKVSRI